MAESANHRQTEAKRSFKQILKAEDPELLAGIKHLLPFVLLIMLLLMLYIGNRYGCQCDMIELEKLKTELSDVNYRLLNSTSDVSARSKPSYIEGRVETSAHGLKTSVESPYELSRAH